MSRRLRILSVCRTLPTPDDPSAGIFVLNRLAAMARHADLTIVQPVPYTPGLRPLPDWARTPGREAQGCRILHAPMFYLPGVLKSADAGWLARSIAPLVAAEHQRHGLDLVDAHFGYPDGAGALRIARRHGLPTFITIRGYENEYVEKPVIAQQLVQALRWADGCMAVSHSLRELALRQGVADERIRVVHNAVDWSAFEYGDAAAARARVGIAAGGPLIVSVGHLIARKRHHVLIESFAGLLESHPDAKLVLIGGNANEPAYRERLLQQIAAQRLSERVILAGNLQPGRIADWLRACDVFALGTAREGCCNAVLEALAAGAPVITTPVGDNAYFVEPGRNGALVPVDDAVAMRQALQTALEPARWNRQEIARALRAAVGTWDEVGLKVLDFMHERLGSPGAAGDAKARRQSMA